MHPLFRNNIAPLAGSEGSVSSVDCNHGVWNATTSTCDCVSGWVTDWTNQDILGGHIVYCDSQASTPAPGNTTAATTKTTSSISTVLIIVVVVVAAAAVVIFGIFCYCCCCRQRSREAPLQQQQHPHAEDGQLQVSAQLHSAESAQQQQQQHLQEQRRAAELKLRQLEDEADWNREALARRQMWDPQMHGYLCSEAAMGEVWSGSIAGLTTNSQLMTHSGPFDTAATIPRRGNIEADFPAFSDPYALAACASPSVHYRPSPSELSSNLYKYDSTAYTSGSDECIYTQYSESPPPALSGAVAVSGASPFTTPRYAEFRDPNMPF